MPIQIQLRRTQRFGSSVFPSFHRTSWGVNEKSRVARRRIIEGDRVAPGELGLQCAVHAARAVLGSGCTHRTVNPIGRAELGLQWRRCFGSTLTISRTQLTNELGSR
jgi:hypothetical protein